MENYHETTNSAHLDDYRTLPNNEEIQKQFDKIHLNLGETYEACKNCPNNPKNNKYSSGFCNCAIPAMNNVIY